MASIISVKNLTFKYTDEGAAVLDGINLELPKGSFTAILGHNGSGKSTLAKHFNSILQPTHGQVLVNGQDTENDDNLLEIRRTVGMVFQNPDNQIVASIVEDDVAFAPENLGIPPAEIRDRVDEALKTVGMYEYRLHSPHRLSGGQKQRVAIAGVLAMSPEVLVLDEPTAMLDPLGRREILKTITKLRREKAMTVVLITHHMEECIEADRLIVMSHGKIVSDGTPREVFSAVQLLESHALSVPETTRLLFELREAGRDVSLSALTVSECADEIANMYKKG